MLGCEIADPDSVEEGGQIRGMELLPVRTVLQKEKHRCQTDGTLDAVEGIFSGLTGCEFTGYEIHMGETILDEHASGLVTIENDSDTLQQGHPDGSQKENVYGCYVHGIFDSPEMSGGFLSALLKEKGYGPETVQAVDWKSYKEEQYDKLAEILRESLDMEKIYEIMGLEEKIHIEQVLPSDIEHRSFEIISEELKAMGKKLEPELAPVIMRAIHTTADFDYADHLKFSENAVEKAREAIKKGAVIITDTKMGWSGVNKKRLESYGGEALCFMADEDVAAEAKKNGSTRAVASMDKAANLFGDGTRPCIFAIGNAPTALIRLYELIQERKIKPALIIGAPVGFVNVIQSKELILSLKDTPYIVAEGRKGGSNVAAAICNALLYGIK